MLPSQSARVSSAGRSPMYRRKSRPGPRLIVGVAIVAAVVGVYFMLPSGKRKQVMQPGAANATPDTNPSVTAEAPKPEAPTPPREERPAPPIVEINQGSGGRNANPADPKPAPSTAAASAPAISTPDPVKPAPVTPAPAPAPDPVQVTLPPSAVDQVAAVSAARQAQRTGDLLSARILFSRALVDGKLMPSEESAVREELTKINEDLVFSPKVTPGDPYSETHKVAAGDSLVRIAQRYKTGPDWRLIQRVNRMPNPNRLREGQSLKVVKGPFHAVVHKSQYRLDLYMGPTDDESKWLYIRSFTVGLGEGNSTPVGTFIVKKASKLVDPYWVNPRTGERFESSDPKNPIGEFWIGLEGIGESLSHVGYGIHGTIDPDSIGKQKSMGCVRLGDADVALMYELLGEQLSMVRIEP